MAITGSHVVPIEGDLRPLLVIHIESTTRYCSGWSTVVINLNQCRILRELLHVILKCYVVKEQIVILAPLDTSIGNILNVAYRYGF